METLLLCPRCNAPVTEGAAFCTNCGNALRVPETAPSQDLPQAPPPQIEGSQEVPPQNLPQTAVPEAAPPQDLYQAPIMPDAVPQITVPGENMPYMPPPPQDGMQSPPQTPPPEKKKKTSLIIGIAAAAVVVLAAAVVSYFLFFAGSGKGSGDDYLIFAFERNLQYTPLSDLKYYSLTERLNDSSNTIYAENYAELHQAILLSDDGRYIFYPDRIGDDYFTYYWRDTKNSGTSVRIDSEITEMPFITADGSKFFYLKGDDDRLYVYDRKTEEKSKLDDTVDEWYVSSAGDYLIYDKKVDDEWVIYEMTLKGIQGEKTKIDSDVYIRKADADTKKVFYTKEDILYFKEHNKDKVKIASDVDRVVQIINMSSVYYLKVNQETIKLSSLVDDDMAAADKSITEPDTSALDYPEYPNYDDYSSMIWIPDEEWGWDYNPETDEWGDWEYDWDEEGWNAAMDRYYAAIDSWEAAWDGYAASYEQYEAKLWRDWLREILDDDNEAVTVSEHSLYYWDNGTEKLAASDVVNWSVTSSDKVAAAAYSKYSSTAAGTRKLSELVEDLYYYEDAYSIARDLRYNVDSARSLEDGMFVVSGEKEFAVDCDEAVYRSIHEDGTIYFLDNYDYDKYRGVLMSVSVSKEKADAPVKIAEDVSVYFFGYGHKNVYYIKDVSENSGLGDLYLLDKRIAEDVHLFDIYNFKGSDTLIFFSDYKNGKGTLNMLKGGTKTKIADDVNSFVALNEKNIAYLADYSMNKEKGDLMLYTDGKTARKIESDVTAILWSVDMAAGRLR